MSNDPHETDSDFNNPEMRALGQYLLSRNIASNSLQFDPREFSRKPDPKTQQELQPVQVQEVLDSFLKWLGKLSSLMKGGGQMEFNAAQFKNMNMRGSNLSPAVIEAALSYILDHRNEYSQLADMGNMIYHDKGSMMNNAGTRVFVYG